MAHIFLIAFGTLLSSIFMLDSRASAASANLAGTWYSNGDIDDECVIDALFLESKGGGHARMIDPAGHMNDPEDNLHWKLNDGNIHLAFATWAMRFDGIYANDEIAGTFTFRYTDDQSDRKQDCTFERS